MAEKYIYTPTHFMAADSYYDKRRADHAVAFIEQLKHTNGEWQGKPFHLLPWQEQIVRDVFGILRKSDGYRQFRTVFAELPKKQGKSELAAAVALYLLCADNEPRAEIYGVANDRKQATIVFDVAVGMVEQQPTLRRFFKILPSQKRIIFTPTNSYYAAMSSEVTTKYGLNIHGCIFDELLGQPDRKLYDAMMRGAGAARRQPLSFVITTAGTDRTSICYEEHCKSVDILEGRKIDPSYYPVVYAAADDDDWTDPDVWRRVNPSLGITVTEEYYNNACESAKQNPAEELIFRQFFLNQWTNSPKRWLAMDKYDKGAEPFTEEDLLGRVCYGGLDLASSDDIAAFVLVFPPDEPNGKYYVLPYFWIPAENMARRVRKDHVPYDKWAAQGYLQTTEGNIIYYDFIEKKILELGEKFLIKQVHYDRWGAIGMTQNLEGHGFELIRFGQGFQSFNEPSKELFRLVLDERFIHGGNPILRWMFENVFIETDAAGSIKPSKKKSTEKIDGAVAAIMGLKGAVYSFEKPKKSVYDTRGLLSLDWF
ncbi:terminase [Clostridia bacterium]|nr:terminase [Clostridia bacterium]